MVFTIVNSRVLDAMQEHPSYEMVAPHLPREYQRMIGQKMLDWAKNSPWHACLEANSSAVALANFDEVVGLLIKVVPALPIGHKRVEYRLIDQAGNGMKLFHQIDDDNNILLFRPIPYLHIDIESTTVLHFPGSPFHIRAHVLEQHSRTESILRVQIPETYTVTQTWKLLRWAAIDSLRDYSTSMNKDNFKCLIPTFIDVAANCRALPILLHQKGMVMKKPSRIPSRIKAPKQDVSTKRHVIKVPMKKRVKTGTGEGSRKKVTRTQPCRGQPGRNHRNK